MTLTDDYGWNKNCKQNVSLCNMCFVTLTAQSVVKLQRKKMQNYGLSQIVLSKLGTGGSHL
jgi:hypothetical protein